MAVKLPDFTAVGFDEPTATNVRPNYYTEDPEAAGQARIGASLEKLGTGVEQAGTAASLLGGQIQHSTNLANGALAQAKFHNDAATTLAQIQRENDPAKVDQLTAQLRGHLDAASQLIPDSGFRNVWLDRHSPELTNFQIAANKRQDQIYNDRYKAGSDGVLQAALQRGTQSDDPAVQEQAKKDIGTVFGSQEQAGVISKEEATVGARKATQQMILGRIENLYMRNLPQEALSYLSANANQLDAASLAHAAGLAHTLRGQASGQVGRDIYAQASTGGGGGVFTAPQGPPIAGANPAEQQMLNEIRHRENGGNYGKTDRSDDNGGGAYQFLGPTWKEATAAAGIGTQYATGAEAPKDVQDAVALSYYRNNGIRPWAASGPYPQPGGGSAVGLIPAFKTSLDQAVADAAKDGITLQLGSGFRTYTEQARLYAQHLKEGGAPVARPGASQHEFGAAMDLRDASGQKIAAGSPEDKWLAANQSKYGLIRPVKGEPWHLQPTTQPSATQAAASPAPGGGASLTLPAVPSYTLPAYNQDTGTFSEPPAAAAGLGLGPGAPLTPTASYAVPADQDTAPGTLVPGGALAPRAAPAVPAAAPVAAQAPAAPAFPPIATPAVPGPDTPEGRYAITLDRINADPRSSDPVAHAGAVRQAEITYRAEEMRIAGALKQRRAISDATTDAYVKQMIAGKTDGIVEAIGQDPRLDDNDRVKLWNIAKEDAKKTVAGTTKTMGPGIYDVLQRITLPDDDPRKIRTSSQIMDLGQPLPNGQPPWLTIEGIDKAQEQLGRANKDSESQGLVKIQNGQLAKAKHILSFDQELEIGIPGLRQHDYKGEDIYNSAFLPAFFKAYNDGLAANKSPYQLLSPGSPDYITDKLIEAHKRSDAEITADKMAAGITKPPQVTEPVGKTWYQYLFGGGGERTLADIAREAAATTDPAQKEALRKEALSLGFIRPDTAAPSAVAPVPPIAAPAAAVPAQP